MQPLLLQLIVLSVVFLLGGCVTKDTATVYNVPTAKNVNNSGNVSSPVTPKPTEQIKAPPAFEVASSTTTPQADKPVLDFPARKSKDTRKRVALVIGNGQYKVQALDNPGNDATDMATKLRSVGFNVNLLKNADHRAMEKAVVDFTTNLDSGSVGLFFYAGHGVQADGQNYLLPIGALPKVNSSNDLRHETVSLDWVLGKLEDSGSKLNIVMLDACRDNPYKRGSRGGSRGLARQAFESHGILISYATGPGDVAQDGEGSRNSPYTSALLRSINANSSKSIESVLKQTSARVQENTNNRQIPFYTSSIVGEFSF